MVKSENDLRTSLLGETVNGEEPVLAISERLSRQDEVILVRQIQHRKQETRTRLGSCCSFFPRATATAKQGAIYGGVAGSFALALLGVPAMVIRDQQIGSAVCDFERVHAAAYNCTYTGFDNQDNDCSHIGHVPLDCLSPQQEGALVDAANAYGSQVGNDYVNTRIAIPLFSIVAVFALLGLLKGLYAGSRQPLEEEETPAITPRR